MSAVEVLKQLLNGMQADRRRYALMQDLLEQQLVAIAQQRADSLNTLAQRIQALVDELDAERRLRRLLVARLLGREDKLSIAALLERLPAGSARLISEAWAALERAITHCKSLNTRNCELIVEQHGLMQRLLGQEQDTYAEL